MDYFVYGKEQIQQHKGIPHTEKIGSVSVKCEYLTAMRLCPMCMSKLWGVWKEMPCVHHDKYVEQKGNHLFYYVFKPEFISFTEMKYCPVCNSKLPATTYGFHIDCKSQKCRPVLINNCNYLIEHWYPLDVIEQLNPDLKPLKSQILETDNIHIVTPDGIAIAGGLRSACSPKYGVHFYIHGDFQSTKTFVDVNLPAAVKKKSREKLQQTIATAETANVSKKSYCIADTEKLKVFLAHLINIEKSIYAVTERLPILYYENYMLSAAILQKKKSALIPISEELQQVEAQLKELRTQDPTAGITIDQMPLPKLNPPAPPVEPEAPVYEKPGLFNKKRILAENALRQEKYENECAHYEEALQQYNQALAEYNKNVAIAKKERKKQYQALLDQVNRNHQNKIQTLENACKKKKAEYKELDKRQSTTLISEEVCLQHINAEICEAEKLLNKLYVSRQEMYGSGVIFEKYHNFVAVSSFYEYICSGRCESLEGTNGAYNLYESEIRMNMVISQLSQVVEQLEKIKENQFIIYSAISEVNRQLSALNMSMSTMNDTLVSVNTTMRDMNTKLTRIEENTEVTAYNSAVTAFYSKKNTELTDALCFLTALG